jgi:hypothetical protein
VRPTIDLPPVIEEPALAEVRDPVDTLRRVRAAIDVDHRFEHIEELGVPGLGAVAERLGIHGRRRR